MIKNTKMNKYLGLTIIIIFIFSSAVLATNDTILNLNNDSINEYKNNDTTKGNENPLTVIDKYIKSAATDEEKEIIGASSRVIEEIEKANQPPNKLSRERVIELYNQGYDFYDIHRAEELSAFCNKTPEEILAVKGKIKYEVVKSKEKDTPTIQENGKSWDEVIKELDIKLIKPTEALGVTAEQIAEMKKQGLTDVEVEEVSVLAFNYKKSYSEVISDLKKLKGASQKGKQEAVMELERRQYHTEETSNSEKADHIKKLTQQYEDKRKEELAKQKVSSKEAKENTEKVLKKQYNITEQDIKKCKQYGVTDIVEISIAKEMANKHKIELDKLLKMKKGKKDWKKVSDELGGGK